MLDSEREPAFERLTALAASMFEVPIATITLVDRARQWFKSERGLDIPETPRDIALCGHAILDDAPLVVRDALDDDRFFDNPLVTGGPNIRLLRRGSTHHPARPPHRHPVSHRSQAARPHPAAAPGVG